MEVRDEVRWFAEEMEKVLQQNDWKGGWKDCSIWQLFKRLEEERSELLRSMMDFEMEKPAKAEKIVKEAVDVANFAMMIADVVRSGS